MKYKNQKKKNKKQKEYVCGECVYSFSVVRQTKQE